MRTEINLPLEDGVIKLDILYATLLESGLTLDELPDPYFLLSSNALDRFCRYVKDITSLLLKSKDLTPKELKTWNNEILTYLKICDKEKLNTDESISKEIYKKIKQIIKAYKEIDAGALIVITSLYSTEEESDHNIVNLDRFNELFEIIKKE